MEIQNDKIFMISLNEDFLSRNFIYDLFSNSINVSSNNKSDTYQFKDNKVAFQGLGRKHYRDITRYVTVVVSPGARLRALQRQIRRSSRIILLVEPGDSGEKFSRVIQKIGKIVAGYVHYRPSPGPRISICIVFVGHGESNRVNMERMKNSAAELFGEFGLPTKFYNAGREKEEGVVQFCNFDREIVFGSVPWHDIPSLNIDKPEIVVNEAVEFIQLAKANGGRICDSSELMERMKQNEIIREGLGLSAESFGELNFNLLLDILDKRGVVRFFQKSQFIMLSSEWYEKFVSYIFQVMKKYSKARSGEYRSRDYCVCSKSDIIDSIRNVTSVVSPAKLTKREGEGFTEFGNFMNSLGGYQREKIIDAILSEMRDAALLDEIVNNNEVIIIYPLKENPEEKIVGRILEIYKPINDSSHPNFSRNIVNKNYGNPYGGYEGDHLNFMKWPSYYGPETRAMIVMGLSTSFELVDVDRGSALFVSRHSVLGNKPTSIVLKYKRLDDASVDMVAFYSLNGRKDFSIFEGPNWRLASMDILQEDDFLMEKIRRFIRDFIKIWTVKTEFAEFGSSLSRIMGAMDMPIHGFAAVSLDDLVAPAPKGFTVIRRKLRNMFVDQVISKNVVCEERQNLGRENLWPAGLIAADSIRKDSDL